MNDNFFEKFAKDSESELLIEMICLKYNSIKQFMSK